MENNMENDDINEVIKTEILNAEIKRIQAEFNIKLAKLRGIPCVPMYAVHVPEYNALRAELDGLSDRLFDVIKGGQ